MAPVAVRQSRWPVAGPRWSRLAQYVVLAVVAFLVVCPLLLVVEASFLVSQRGAPASFGFDAWSTAFSTPGIRAALWNTLLLILVRQSISFAIAIMVAWVLARTDIPGRRWLEFLFLLAFFLPTIPVVEAWVILLDPDYGIINGLMTALPLVREPPFNIYSFPGIIWVHLAHTAIATKIVLLAVLFRNMDSSLEEMARICGSSLLGTLKRITLPVLMPGLVTVFLIGAFSTLHAFEIETILGPPFRFSIFSTEVFRLINRDPPNYAAATALSSFVLATMVPFVIMQRWATGRTGHATVGSQYRCNTIALGRWRRPVFAATLGLALLTTLVPVAVLLVFSFARKWGYYDIDNPWTVDNWTRVLADQTFLASLTNSLKLGVGTAIAGMIGFSIVSYIIVRTRFAWRSALDFLTWLPSLLPGVILSLGLLYLYLWSPATRPIYGSIFGMVIATLIGCMTIGVQVIKSNFMQIGAELEESARVAGASRWRVYRTVFLPLTMPAVLLCGTISFALAIRNVSSVVFLGTAGNRPLSLLQLDFMTEGWYEPACVVGLVLTLVTTVVAFVAARVGMRFEIGR